MSCRFNKKITVRRLLLLLCIFIYLLSPLIYNCEASQRETPIVNVVRDNSAAVVNISTESIVLLQENPYWGGYGSEFDLFFKSFFGIRPGTHALKLSSVGSGVVVDKDGLIVTNAHVVKMASNIIVIFNDSTRTYGQVVFVDLENDLAIIKVNIEKDLQEINFADSEDVMIGETAVAIGNPLGLESSVTAGVVSGKNREFADAGGRHLMSGLIQTDAPINPGNSGGALLNLDGELIGISVAVVQNSQSIGFAVPAEKVVFLKEAYLAGISEKKFTDKLTATDASVKELTRNFDSSFSMGGYSDVDVEVSDEGDEYIFTVDITGMDPDTVDVDINKQRLSISAVSSSLTEETSGGTVYRSRSYGRIAKSVSVPQDADIEQMASEISGNELIIKLSKK